MASKKKRTGPSSPNAHLDAQMKVVERQLHQLIQNFSLVGKDTSNNNAGESTTASRESIISSQSTSSLNDLDINTISLKGGAPLTITLLRQRMRIVRRWRHGSKICRSDDLKEFHEFLLTARLRTVVLQKDQLRKDLEDLDLIVSKTGATDGARTLRLKIECDLNALEDTVQNLLVEDSPAEDKEVSQVEQAYKELVSAYNTLKSQLLAKEKAESHQPSGRAELSRGQSFERRRSRVRRKSFKKLTKIEEHPSVNRVLRNIGRVMRMIQVLKNGGHITNGENETDTDLTTDGEGRRDQGSCADHDSEVLDRQLQRLHRWHKLSEEFKNEDLEDLEQIVMAIERHIKPDINLDSPMRKVSQAKVILSEGDSEVSTPIPMNGHVTRDHASHPDSTSGGVETETSPEDGILNERLV